MADAALDHEALDDTYVLARTGWRGERAGGDRPVRQASTCLLRRRLDVDTPGELFDETFVAVDPDGAQPVPRANHQDLRGALSSG